MGSEVRGRAFRKIKKIDEAERTRVKKVGSAHKARDEALAAAVSYLSEADPKIAKIIEHVGKECSITTHPDPFRSLVEAIIYQQLAGGAADAIAGRFLKIYGGASFPTPLQILATEQRMLRSSGLSGRKTEYILDLAARVADGRLDLSSISSMADDEMIIEQLTQVKGIGRWTAEMFLIFCLGRMDVLPVGDLGLRRAIQLSYGLYALPSPEVIRKIAGTWKPYSTVATWYLWKSLEKFKAIG